MNIELPLVRRIYPPLIAEKIVNVQPLTGPAGLVYYLKWRYANREQVVPVPKMTPEEEAKHNAGVAAIHTKYPWLKRNSRKE